MEKSDLKIKRFAFLISDLNSEHQTCYIQQLSNAARLRKVNLVIIEGGTLNHPHEANRRKNYLHKLVNKKTFDGVIALSSILGLYASDEEMADFLKSFDLPVVSIGKMLPGTFSIMNDNYGGMYQVVDHLIKTHRKTAIAFIAGPERSQSAGERFRAYRDSLLHNGLDYRPELVVQGNFEFADGEAALGKLLDSPDIKIDGLVACNVKSLLGGLQALQTRGYRVPEDLAVAGFDNTLSSRLNVPPLTTTSQPYREAAFAALDYFLKEKDLSSFTEKSVWFPSRMILRESCGCRNGWPSTTYESLRLGDFEKPDFLTKALETFFYQFDQYGALGEDPDFLSKAEAFLGALKRALAEKDPLLCKNQARDLVNYLSFISADISYWRVMFSLAMTSLAAEEPGLLDFNSSLKDLLRDLEINEIVRERFHIQHSFEQFMEIGGRMILADGFAYIAEVLKEKLPSLGISSLELSLFEDLAAYFDPAPKSGSLVGASESLGPRGKARLVIRLGPGVTNEQPGLTFDASDLVPPGSALTRDFGQTYLLPLYNEGQALGFLLIEQQNQISPLVYNALCVALSKALQSVLAQRVIWGYTGHVEETIKKRTQELREANEALREATYRDVLTGLRNRRYLVEVISPEARLIQKTSYRNSLGSEVSPDKERAIGLILMDLDLFKSVNDQYGHLAGDSILKQISEVIKASTRRDDVSLRWGGEEFMLVLRNFSSGPAELFELAEKLRKSIRGQSYFVEQRIVLRCTSSLGCFVYPPNLDDNIPIDFDHALSLVDNALYTAKRRGRDCTVLVELQNAAVWQQLGPGRVISAFNQSVEEGLIKLSTSR